MNRTTVIEREEAQRLKAAGHWLVRFRQDTLSDAEMSSWIEWCETDPKNLQAFEDLQSLWRAAGEHPPQKRVRPSLRSRRWMALAASLLVAAIGAGIVLINRGTPGPKSIARIELVQTPVAINQPGVLPDGSLIEIGARSVVDVNFTGPRRELELRDGEAFFRVKHDKAHPFVVKAGRLEVIAVGTAFNVRRTGSQVIVTVQEGSVDVRSSGSADRESVRAHAGQQLSFESGTGEIHDSEVDPAVTLAWRSGRLEFTGDPLSVVVANVNRYSKRPVILGDARLGTLTFTGTVFFDNVDAWLDGLQQVFPIDVHRGDPQEIILTRRRTSP